MVWSCWRSCGRKRHGYRDREDELEVLWRLAEARAEMRALELVAAVVDSAA